jgi:dipeptidyl aminopeptidase/acylaminoacyl peptidase
VPGRTVFESNESGVWQVHRWDAVSGERAKVSDHPVGVLEGYASADGSEVVYWQEDTGDETGRWLAQAWDGGGTEPFVAGVPDGWSEGFAQASGSVVAGVSDRDGFVLFAAVDGEAAKEIARSTEWMAVGGAMSGQADLAGLSAEGSLLAVEHAEHGDLIHPALRIIDVRTSAVLGERHDDGLALLATAWSPVAGDRRLAVVHERGDRERPAVWDLAEDSWTDLAVDVPGDARVLDWWPDASALLLHHAFEGRHELFRHDVATGETARIQTPTGTISDARVRPDGSVWFLHSDAVNRHRVLDDRGSEPVAVPGEAAPPGRPFVPWRFTNRSGQSVHGFTVAPGGSAPWPVMMFVHGGPHWLYEDRYMPEVQAYVDAGFLVGIVNYRGSTGYGRRWRDALTGDVGFTDVDDVTDGLADLVVRGVADPERAVVAGWSWGGYITLMELGREPERWIAGVACVPVADYVMAYRDEAPSLQAMDRALMGGSPDDVPERYRRGNPIAYVDRVRAPVLFVIGDNDSRCPLDQALAYTDRLQELGRPNQVYRYTTGHGSNDVDEEVRQQRVILDFLREHVPGLNDV